MSFFMAPLIPAFSHFSTKIFGPRHNNLIDRNKGQKQFGFAHEEKSF